MTPYFTEETDAAIIEYNKTDDLSMKNKIFDERLKEPLAKLVECTLHRYDFPYTGFSDADAQRDCLDFLATKLPYFNPARCNKAFSYFGVIIKNYFIQMNERGWVETKRHVRGCFDASETNEEGYDNDTIMDLIGYHNSSQSLHDSKDFFNGLLDHYKRNLHALFKPRDLPVACGVLELMANANNLELNYKKEHYMYLRRLTGQKSAVITRIIKCMNREYLRFKKMYVNHEV